MPQAEFRRLAGTGEIRVAALEVLDVRFRIYRAAPSHLRRLDGGELDGDLARHRFRELALEAEDVLELPVIPVGPERLVRARRDELHAHAHTIADQVCRAFEHGIHVQLARDLGHGELRALVAHHRRSRDHAQRLDTRQVGDDRLGHAVGEVFLEGIARHVA